MRPCARAHGVADAGRWQKHRPSQPPPPLHHSTLACPRIAHHMRSFQKQFVALRDEVAVEEWRKDYSGVFGVSPRCACVVRSCCRALLAHWRTGATQIQLSSEGVSGNMLPEKANRAEPYPSPKGSQRLGVWPVCCVPRLASLPLPSAPPSQWPHGYQHGNSMRWIGR